MFEHEVEHVRIARVMSSSVYCIAGNFRVRKFSQISRITGYSRKYYLQMSCFLLTKIGQ